MKSFRITVPEPVEPPPTMVTMELTQEAVQYIYCALRLVSTKEWRDFMREYMGRAVTVEKAQSSRDRVEAELHLSENARALRGKLFCKDIWL